MTSPPYDELRVYDGYGWHFETVARELYRVTKTGGVIVWVVADQTKNGSESGNSFRQALFFRDVLGLSLYDTMIYKTAKPPLTKRRYEPAFEFMFVLVKGQSPNCFNGLTEPKRWPEKKPRVKQYAKNFDNSIDWGSTVKSLSSTHRLKTNVWDISNRRHTGRMSIVHQHPGRFPDELARDHILTWTNENDIVLDPMMGSGTTPRVAKVLKRRYIGIELSPKYVEIAKTVIGYGEAQGC